MREKKRCAVITFRTTTEAMEFEARCTGENIPGRLIPTPRELSASCGLAWRMTAEEYAAFAPKLTALGLACERTAELMP